MFAVVIVLMTSGKFNSHTHTRPHIWLNTVFWRNAYVARCFHIIQVILLLLFSIRQINVLRTLNWSGVCLCLMCYCSRTESLSSQNPIILGFVSMICHINLRKVLKQKPNTIHLTDCIVSVRQKYKERERRCIFDMRTYDLLHRLYVNAMNSLKHDIVSSWKFAGIN